MPRAELSYPQRGTLTELRDRPNGPTSRRGCTNATLSALERRGLVKLEFVPSPHIASVRVEHWSITDRGREVLG